MAAAGRVWCKRRRAIAYVGIMGDAITDAGKRLVTGPEVSKSAYAARATKGGGASSRSGDCLFELDLGGEAVTIAPDRQNRQPASAMPVGHGAVLRL